MIGKKSLKWKFKNKLMFSSGKYFIFANFDVGFDLGVIGSFLKEHAKYFISYQVYFRDTSHYGQSSVNFFENGCLKKKKIVFTFRNSSILFSIFSYFLNFFQIFKIRSYIFFQRKDVILFSPNPVFCLFGILLRMKVVYIVGDIMRINKESIPRSILDKFIRGSIVFSLKRSSYVWFISESLQRYLKRYKNKNKNSIVFPMAIHSGKRILFKQKKGKAFSIVYIGSFDKSKGIDSIFKLAKRFPSYEFIFIGDSKKNIPETIDNVTVYPPILDESVIEKILRERNCIAIAPYSGDSETEEFGYLGDPIKIKQYLSYGFPVITTKIIYFGKDLELYKAGIRVSYNMNDFEIAIKKIISDYDEYILGVDRILDKFNSEKLYKNFIPDIIEKIYAKN